MYSPCRIVPSASTSQETRDEQGRAINTAKAEKILLDHLSLTSIATPICISRPQAQSMASGLLDVHVNTRCKYMLLVGCKARITRAHFPSPRTRADIATYRSHGRLRWPRS